MTIPGEGNLSINDYIWTAPGKTTLPGGSVSTRTYDGLLQPQSLRLKNPGQQQILSLDNQWDNRQQLNSAARSDSSPAGSLQHNNQYSYDAALRLTEVETDTGGLFGSTQTYTLDALANRTQDSTTGNWIYDANNRLLQRGSGSEQVSYQYDANGNQLQQTSAAGTTRYIYDTNNRLQAIYSGAEQLIARYSYDPLNRRISKEQYRTADGTPLPQPLRTYYLYSDEGLLAESQQFIQPNADGSVTALNTPAISSQYGPVPDAPFSTGILFIKTRDHNGNDLVAYYQHNHLQAPLQAIDKQGNIRWAAQYAAFGQTSIISSGDSAINSNLRLPGQYADSESGLYYNWQRYYDANTGRYISSDPIGLAGGFNRYVYVGGNPIGWVDPSGEFAIGAAIGGVVGGAIGIYDAIKGYTKCGKKINWGNVAVQGIIGGVAGALSGAVPKGIGAIGVVDGIAAGLSEAANSYFNDSSYNILGVIGNTVGGAGGGVAGFYVQNAIFGGLVSPHIRGSIYPAHAFASGVGGAVKPAAGYAASKGVNSGIGAASDAISGGSGCGC